MRWLYQSPIGTINIIEHANGLYYIVINGTSYGGYQSAVEAADDVYTFSTGCNEWDTHCTDIAYLLNVPTDIHEWVRVN